MLIMHIDLFFLSLFDNLEVENCISCVVVVVLGKYIYFLGQFNFFLYVCVCVCNLLGQKTQNITNTFFHSCFFLVLCRFLRKKTTKYLLYCAFYYFFLFNK